jgi:prophage DNA circulation protein
MAWREEVKGASYRGIRFYVETSSVSFGRRNALHEYPYKNKPFVEDLGRKAKTFSFNAYLLGDDYIRDRTRLIKAIENNETSGTLIHPTLGTIQVKPTDGCSISDNGRQGGKGVITLEFVEAGENTFPNFSLFTESQILSLFGEIQTSLISAFPEVYKVAQIGGFVVNSAIATTQEYIDTFRTVQNIGAKISNKVSDFKRNLASFEDNLNIIATSPTTFITSISNLFDDFNEIFSNPSDKYEASKQLQEFSPTYESRSYTTPSRIQENANNNQIVETMRSFSLAIMSQATAEETFDSKSKVTQRRNEILDVYETRIEQAGIAEQNQVRSDLINLRSATVGYLNESSDTLPDIQTVAYNSTLPAYYIANELYGDSLRYEEIVNDNGIQHPLFVPMGKDLEVLTS